MVFRNYVRFTLMLLFVTLVFGLLSSWAFLYPETYNSILPFQQLRPMHVSAALFWIISGATCCAVYYGNDVLVFNNNSKLFIRSFIFVWMITIVIIFVFYAFKQYGGREYWEFPPWLSIPVFISWILLMIGYFSFWFKIPDKKPLYVIMWATGILFFCLTFLEQNLWQIDWFRQSYMRELTVQWKANGSMVGAWNQMIYGTSLYLMVKISGDKTIAESKPVYFFYFLSLSNLMFNWGHHIYNLPTAGWVRHLSYFISMTEWLFFISMIRSFKSKLEAHRKLKYLLTYRFIIASEFWLFLNLLLALMMSIPAINRYTHGTHITVAHAMGTTIGINSMILMAGIGYLLGVENLDIKRKKIITTGYYITQVSLLFFWLSLIISGLLKGYRNVALNITDFQEIMKPVIVVLKVFSIAGIGVLIGMAMILFIYSKSVKTLVKSPL